MTHIYNEKLEHIISLNYDYDNFKKNPSLYYSDWQTSYYASPTKYEYPIIDTDDVIREMTREEKILNLGMEELLIDGEILEDGKIKSIEAPKTLIRAAWNKETKEWYETMTKEELLEKRAQKIIEYSNLENEKKTLENSRFTTEDEIQLVVDKMLNLELEINNLADQIELINL